MGKYDDLNIPEGNKRALELLDEWQQEPPVGEGAEIEVEPFRLCREITDAERDALSKLREWRAAELAQEALPVGERMDAISAKYNALDALRAAADALAEGQGKHD